MFFLRVCYSPTRLSCISLFDILVLFIQYSWLIRAGLYLWSQKLLVGDFPHELDMDEMEEDVPKRKNRTKGRVKHMQL